MKQTIIILTISLAGCGWEVNPCESLPLYAALNDGEREDCQECNNHSGCDGEAGETGDEESWTCREAQEHSHTKVCYEGDLSFPERALMDAAIEILRPGFVARPWSDNPGCEHQLVRYDAFASPAAQNLGAVERVARLCWTRQGEPDFEAQGELGPVAIGNSFALFNDQPAWNHAMPEWWKDADMLDPATYLAEEITVCESVRCGLERWECRCECESDSDCEEYDFFDSASGFEAFGICEFGQCFYDAECFAECP